VAAVLGGDRHAEEAERAHGACQLA
jgi:hypothetical protein